MSDAITGESSDNQSDSNQQDTSAARRATNWRARRKRRMVETMEKIRSVYHDTSPDVHKLPVHEDTQKALEFSEGVWQAMRHMGWAGESSNAILDTYHDQMTVRAVPNYNNQGQGVDDNGIPIVTYDGWLSVFPLTDVARASVDDRFFSIPEGRGLNTEDDTDDDTDAVSEKIVQAHFASVKDKLPPFTNNRQLYQELFKPSQWTLYGSDNSVIQKSLQVDVTYGYLANALTVGFSNTQPGNNRKTYSCPPVEPYKPGTEYSVKISYKGDILQWFQLKQTTIKGPDGEELPMYGLFWDGDDLASTNVIEDLKVLTIYDGVVFNSSWTTPRRVPGHTVGEQYMMRFGDVTVDAQTRLCHVHPPNTVGIEDYTPNYALADQPNRCPWLYAHFVNTSSDPEKINCKFTNEGVLRQKKGVEIKRGDELFVDYGWTPTDEMKKLRLLNKLPTDMRDDACMCAFEAARQFAETIARQRPVSGRSRGVSLTNVVECVRRLKRRGGEDRDGIWAHMIEDLVRDGIAAVTREADIQFEDLEEFVSGILPDNDEVRNANTEGDRVEILYHNRSFNVMRAAIPEFARVTGLFRPRNESDNSNNVTFMLDVTNNDILVRTESGQDFPAFQRDRYWVPIVRGGEIGYSRLLDEHLFVGVEDDELFHRALEFTEFRSDPEATDVPGMGDLPLNNNSGHSITGETPEANSNQDYENVVREGNDDSPLELGNIAVGDEMGLGGGGRSGTDSLIPPVVTIQDGKLLLIRDNQVIKHGHMIMSLLRPRPRSLLLHTTTGFKQSAGNEETLNEALDDFLPPVARWMVQKTRRGDNDDHRHRRAFLAGVLEGFLRRILSRATGWAIFLSCGGQYGDADESVDGGKCTLPSSAYHHARWRGKMEVFREKVKEGAPDISGNTLDFATEDPRDYLSTDTAARLVRGKKAFVERAESGTYIVVYAGQRGQNKDEASRTDFPNAYMHILPEDIELAIRTDPPLAALLRKVACSTRRLTTSDRVAPIMGRVADMGRGAHTTTIASSGSSTRIIRRSGRSTRRRRRRNPSTGRGRRVRQRRIESQWYMPADLQELLFLFISRVAVNNQLDQNLQNPTSIFNPGVLSGNETKSRQFLGCLVPAIRALGETYNASVTDAIARNVSAVTWLNDRSGSPDPLLNSSNPYLEAAKKVIPALAVHGVTKVDSAPPQGPAVDINQYVVHGFDTTDNNASAALGGSPTYEAICNSNVGSNYQNYYDTLNKGGYVTGINFLGSGRLRLYHEIDV